MHLAQLDVKHFRCLDDVTFDFRPGLNVILGENNAGKTALVDALRLLMSQGYGPRVNAVLEFPISPV